ncbi:hypothetical protein DFP72DRAFT_820919 [Ephemerocybe angulata]|uniref:Uncharacterized protein n=1 Tax=Ephemerocybe angulata TaxID=980116 RepID=A0A8H6HKI9_9AGAR|nr:hypothetical protein DFP72DRAFT_820919 [Tulosesus angulatus]
MNRHLLIVTNAILNSNGWKKFANPTVRRGSTAWPRKPGMSERYGVRYTYDGERDEDGTPHHIFRMQPSSGKKLPPSIERWISEAKRGSRGIMAEVVIPKDGSMEDVKAGLTKAHRSITDHR